MKNFIISLVILTLAVTFSAITAEKCFAAIFFNDSVTPEQLRLKYESAKLGGTRLKILLVPGHDQANWGTEYKGLKEADLNYESALELYQLLSKRKEFEVIMARDAFDYKTEIATYLATKREEIKNFITEHRSIMDLLLYSNVIKSNDSVYHNQANGETINTLYGINKWSNENGVDLVIHLHVNDTPERKYNKPGKYKGFVIYVPDHQFSNGNASIKIGQSIFKQMSKYFAVSNMPKESSGVVEDQKLIALGANNTLSPAAILIEYGYIYRPSIANSKTRPALFKKMTKQTANGIINFFEDK